MMAAISLRGKTSVMCRSTNHFTDPETELAYQNCSRRRQRHSLASIAIVVNMLNLFYAWSCYFDGIPQFWGYSVASAFLGVLCIAAYVLDSPFLSKRSSALRDFKKTFKKTGVQDLMMGEARAWLVAGAFVVAYIAIAIHLNSTMHTLVHSFWSAKANHYQLTFPTEQASETFLAFMGSNILARTRVVHQLLWQGALLYSADYTRCLFTGASIVLVSSFCFLAENTIDWTAIVYFQEDTLGVARYTGSRITWSLTLFLIWLPMARMFDQERRQLWRYRCSSASSCLKGAQDAPAAHIRASLRAWRQTYLEEVCPDKESLAIEVGEWSSSDQGAGSGAGGTGPDHWVTTTTAATPAGIPPKAHTGAFSPTGPAGLDATWEDHVDLSGPLADEVVDCVSNLLDMEYNSSDLRVELPDLTNEEFNSITSLNHMSKAEWVSSSGPMSKFFDVSQDTLILVSRATASIGASSRQLPVFLHKLGAGDAQAGLMVLTQHLHRHMMLSSASGPYEYCDTLRTVNGLTVNVMVRMACMPDGDSVVCSIKSIASSDSESEPSTGRPSTDSEATIEHSPSIAQEASSGRKRQRNLNNNSPQNAIAHSAPRTAKTGSKVTANSKLPKAKWMVVQGEVTASHLPYLPVNPDADLKRAWASMCT